ncbi:MAG: DUF2225 domain-containing protein [Spirochaetales bacterium]|jgi:uncharacterized protein (DUF2225 family)|nr:DUF2225 domain-containing protein [Spirochaetales bacterium]
MLEDGAKLTFLSKKNPECPVCQAPVVREELYTGRGRLIAGELTDELRRLYQPSQKFGEVFPLIYSIMVCPECYYAAFSSDFSQVPGPTAEALQGSTDARKQGIKKLFPVLDYNNPRTLKEGASSYFLAMYCYDSFPKNFNPLIKQGLCALRAAWLCTDLHRLHPQDNFDYLSRLFYRKAAFFYVQAVENETTGRESVADVPNLGPDLDKNYGYDGVLYLSALLEYRYGPRENAEYRQQALEEAKRTVARIFGMGKASKNKPEVLLTRSKDLHETLTKELTNWDSRNTDAEVGDLFGAPPSGPPNGK